MLLNLLCVPHAVERRQCLVACAVVEVSRGYVPAYPRVIVFS